jgi:hypothetical protein
MIANGDLETLLKSGFDARSQERASVPLPTPTGLTVTNEGEGKLTPQVEPVKNCSMYEGRAKPDGGAWGTSVFTGDSRHILFDGLTPGVMTPSKYAASAARPEPPTGPTPSSTVHCKFNIG